MTDVWSERAEAFRESATHREGPDLDLLIEWCEPGEGVQALDVATGGGHVARRLREAGCDVVSVDPAPGMQPTVVARAELSFRAAASADGPDPPATATRVAPASANAGIKTELAKPPGPTKPIRTRPAAVATERALCVIAGWLSPTRAVSYRNASAPCGR